jgi:hypothetical protein
MKNIIKEEVFSKHFDGDLAHVRFSDLPKDIQENDIIQIDREDDFYSENNSYDAYTQLVIIREREETDEEYHERMSEIEKSKVQMKNMRFKTYLKLKEEFEPTKDESDHGTIIIDI